MALVNCPECNKEISNTVRKCHNCGYTFKKKINKKTIKNIKIGIIAFSIIALSSLSYSLISGYASTKDINSKIDSIGEVTINSEDAISTIENEYNGLNAFKKVFVFKHNILVKAREKINSLPIPLTKDNIMKYVTFNISFRNYAEDNAVFLGYNFYSATANADITTKPLKDKYFDNVIITLKYNVFFSLVDNWKEDEITLKLSPDGTSQSTGNVKYSSLLLSSSMPTYNNDMTIINISGNVYNNKPK